MVRKIEASHQRLIEGPARFAQFAVGHRRTAGNAVGQMSLVPLPLASGVQSARRDPFENLVAFFAGRLPK